MAVDNPTTDREAERNEILRAMQNRATDGVPVRAGDIVHAGDDELDAQIVVGKIKEPGVVAIYDTRTGERSLTSRHMLNLQLSKMREDGSLAFSKEPPRDTRGHAIEPKRGKLKCMLHPDDPNRTLYDSWGLTTCTKDCLPSRQEVKSHMQRRHKREWATIEEDRLERQQEKDRKLQEAILVAAARGQAQPEETAQRNKKAG